MQGVVYCAESVHWDNIVPSSSPQTRPGPWSHWEGSRHPGELCQSYPRSSGGLSWTIHAGEPAQWTCPPQLLLKFLHTDNEHPQFRDFIPSLTTCWLHSARLSARKLPYVVTTILSTLELSRTFFLRSSFSQTFLSTSVCSPSTWAPTFLAQVFSSSFTIKFHSITHIVLAYSPWLSLSFPWPSTSSPPRSWCRACWWSHNVSRTPQWIFWEQEFNK